MDKPSACWASCQASAWGFCESGRYLISQKGPLVWFGAWGGCPSPLSTCLLWATATVLSGWFPTHCTAGSRKCFPPAKSRCCLDETHLVPAKATRCLQVFRELNSGLPQTAGTDRQSPHLCTTVRGGAPEYEEPLSCGLSHFYVITPVCQAWKEHNLPFHKGETEAQVSQPGDYDSCSCHLSHLRVPVL